MKFYKFMVALPEGKTICVAAQGSTMPRAKKRVADHYKVDKMKVHPFRGLQEPITRIEE